MFSELNQGSPIYIIDKTDELKYKTGEITNISYSSNYFGGTFGTPSFTPSGNMTIKVKLDNNIIDYPEIPRNNTSMSYNNGDIIVCDSTQSVVKELENVLQQTKQILADHSKYEQIVIDCENLLKDINPSFAKDKERDDRINSLDSKVTNMEGKLDQILNVLSTKQ